MKKHPKLEEIRKGLTPEKRAELEKLPSPLVDVNREIECTCSATDLMPLGECLLKECPERLKNQTSPTVAGQPDNQVL